MDISTWQILWGINTTLLALMLWLHKDIRREMKDIKDELAKKASTVICEKIHSKIDKSLHRHATSGAAGEVVETGGAI